MAEAAGPRLENTIIHLIGNPAAGKYTVGAEVARLTGARFVDNHSIANVIFNLIDPDGVTPLPAGVWPRVAQVRAAVLDALVHVAPRHLSYVLTNYIRAEDPAEEAAFLEIVAAADARESTYVPVVMHCDTEELVRRVTMPDRRARMKLVDPVAVRRLGDEVPLYVPRHANTMEMDVTRLAPEESARRIVAWVRECADGQASRAGMEK